MEDVTKSAKETKNFGKKVGNYINKGGFETESSAVVLALKGELGSGKTTFVQGLARTIGVKQRIVSPTFIIVREYHLPKNKNFKRFYHVDLYRLDEDADQEISNLGLRDIWKDKENIVAIEWPEKASGAIPGDAVWVEFENYGEDIREIKVNIV